MSETLNYKFPKPDEANNLDDEMRRLQVAWDKLDGLLKQLSDLVADKAAASHTHTIAQIKDLQTALNNKMASNKTFSIGDLVDVLGSVDAATGYILQKNTDGKFVFSSPAAVLGNHQHVIADIVELRNELDAITASILANAVGDTLDRDQFRSVPVKTTTNAFTYSEQLNQSAWTKSGLVVTADAVAAPDAKVTADKIVKNSGGATTYIGRNATLVAGSQYTFSFFAKAAELTQITAYMAAAVLPAVQQVMFDLSTGKIVSKANAVDAGIEDWGNGWYRCWIVSQAATAGGANSCRIYPTGNGSVSSPAGDGVMGVYVWGVQIETAKKVGPYVPTTTAAASMSIYSNRHLAEELAAKVVDLQSAINNIAVVPIGTIIDVYGNGTATFPGFLKVVPGLEITASYPELRTWALANGWATNASGNPVMPSTDSLFKRQFNSGQTRDAGRAFGSVQEDAQQRVQGELGGLVGGAQTKSGAFASDNVAIPNGYSGGGGVGVQATFDNARVARTANENRPANLTVTWYIKAYPASVSQGSVDVPKLADDIAAVASRSTALENSKGIKAQAAVNLSSSAITFAGIPAGVQSFVLKLNNVTKSAATQLCVKLGTAGGIASSGYTGRSVGFNGSSLNGGPNYTTYAALDDANSLVTTAGATSGHVEFKRLAPGSNVWTYNSIVTREGTGTALATGVCTLSAELTQVQLAASNTAVLGGSAAIEWEF